MINMTGIGLLTKGFKIVFERERLELLEQYDGTGFSFPSGHSSGASAFYGFLIYKTSISKIDSSLKWVINCSLGVLILLIGVSRLYLGVHYLTDILTGVFGGAYG